MWIGRLTSYPSDPFSVFITRNLQALPLLGKDSPFPLIYTAENAWLKGKSRNELKVLREPGHKC